MRRFFQRVWRDNVTPLLKGKSGRTRRKTARVGGMFAAATGTFIDSVLGLRGRPFTRSMTVMGTRLGAILPDAWEWDWWHAVTDQETRTAVASEVERGARELPEADALALFELTPSATLDDLKAAWRRVSQDWHPDKAPDERLRGEYHLRFVAYRAAYERLRQAFDEGRLPIQGAHG